MLVVLDFFLDILTFMKERKVNNRRLPINIRDTGPAFEYEDCSMVVWSNKAVNNLSQKKWERMGGKQIIENWAYYRDVNTQGI